MIRRLAHVCLISDDLARCESFYCGALGLKKRFRFLQKDRVIGFYLEAGDRQFIEVFLGDGSQPAHAGRLTHLCLEVNDIHETAARLDAAGVERTAPKLGCDASWQVWCMDPDGVRIEFHQYTEQSHQLNGDDCTVDW